MGSHVNELPRFLIHDRVQLSDLASTSSWGGSCGAHDLVQSDPGLSSRTVPDRSPWDTLGRSTPPEQHWRHRALEGTPCMDRILSPPH